MPERFVTLMERVREPPNAQPQTLTITITITVTITLTLTQA